MKIKGKLALIMVSIDKELYEPYLVYENGVPVLYVEMQKALYGLLQSLCIGDWTRHILPLSKDVLCTANWLIVTIMCP